MQLISNVYCDLRKGVTRREIFRVVVSEHIPSERDNASDRKPQLDLKQIHCEAAVKGRNFGVGLRPEFP